MTPMFNHLNKVMRRIQAAMGMGIITAPVNDSGPVQTAQVQFYGIETRDNLNVLYHFGFTANPPVGTAVMANFVSGDRSNGAVVATANAHLRPTGLQPGEVKLYDAFGNNVWLHAAGITLTDCNGNVLLMQAGKTRLVTPRFEVTGDIIDQCDSRTNTQAADRAIYDAHTHLVPNVQTGGSSVTTNPPTVIE